MEAGVGLIWPGIAAPVQGLHDVDWQRPWLAPLAALGREAAARVAAGASVAQALNAAQGGGAMPFVPQAALPAGVAYEQFIFETGSIPTRDHLHDFFNGLIWLHYPETKRALNRWQAQAIAAQGVGAVRGPVRDAITVLDENGAVLLAPPALHAALQQRDWCALGGALRGLWQDARLVLLGHALLEKLVYPRKPITAHVYCALGAIESVVSLDAELAQRLTPSTLQAKPFFPLPVLGVPGWWAENANFGFYEDAKVFRPARPLTALQGAAP